MSHTPLPWTVEPDSEVGRYYVEEAYAEYDELTDDDLIDGEKYSDEWYAESDRRFQLAMERDGGNAGYIQMACNNFEHLYTAVVEAVNVLGDFSQSNNAEEALSILEDALSKIL